jgi:hypothetical protein
MIVFGEKFLVSETNPESRRMRLTTIVGKLWKEKTAENGVDPNTLKTIWRANIVGAEAQHVIRKYLQQHPTRNEFMPGEEEFEAILGTDNGKGVAHFLTDWQ